MAGLSRARIHPGEGPIGPRGRAPQGSGWRNLFRPGAEAAGGSRPAPPFMAGVPNTLSLLRILLALVFPFLEAEGRFALALVSGLSDWVDGFLARRYGLCSVVGGLLDAFGDKLFMAVAFVTFAVEGSLSTWQVWLVLSRDLIVCACVLGVVILRRFDAFRRMPANRLGKAATLGQFLLILAVLSHREHVRMLHPPVAALSLLAGGSYLLRFLWGLRESV